MSKHVDIKEWMEIQANYIVDNSDDLGYDYVLEILQETYQAGYLAGTTGAKKKEEPKEDKPMPPLMHRPWKE